MRPVVLVELALALAAAASLCACASARQPVRPAAVSHGEEERPGLPVPKAEAKEQQQKEQPAYERILGSFPIDPNAILYLDPVLCGQHLYEYGSDYRGIAERFHRIGALRGEAAARLNQGALEWFSGEPDEAYREVMDAQRIFAELGDVEGLAHTYEWLGYFFKESSEPKRAAEHLSVAYRFFEAVGDASSLARVLSYAE
jgi:hypothetical protein